LVLNREIDFSSPLMSSTSSYQKLFFGNSIQKHWNLVEVVDEFGKPTEFIAVRGEIRSRLGEQCLLKQIRIYKKKLIGLCSYQEFPQQFCNPHDTSRYTPQRFIERFGNDVVLWCHCFRDPWNYFPMNVPALLYSETDQYPHSRYLHGLVGTVEKKYDFFVSIQDGAWNDHIRGIRVAEKWLGVMADQMGLKILVCGNHRRQNFPSPNIDVIDFQKWSDFVQCMNSARALFCSSIYDASPRIIVESLSLDMPVLLNKNILGGWKYIGEDTGRLFDPEMDPVQIQEFVGSFLAQKFSPLEYSRATFDDIHANAEFLAHHIRTLTSLRYEDFVDGFLFINLEERMDRRQSMQNEFKRMGIPATMIHRIPAIREERCGHLGCAKSHVEALSVARQKGWKRFVILEDDFRFRVNQQQFLYTLSRFYQNTPCQEEGGVFLLAHYYLKEESTPLPTLIRQVIQATTTAGYLVCDGNAGKIQTLLDVFQGALVDMTEELRGFLEKYPHAKMMETQNAIDQRWLPLQREQGCFYTSDPVIGVQDFSSPSSIMGPLRARKNK